MPTYLTALIEQSVQTSLTTTLSRTAERIAESMAEEMLRNPVFRQRMQALIELAFERALAELATDRPVPPTGPART